jgi:hypothetical protein
MTREQYRKIRKVVLMMARFRRPYDAREAATWAMWEAKNQGVDFPSFGDFRAFDKIGARAAAAV